MDLPYLSGRRAFISAALLFLLSLEVLPRVAESGCVEVGLCCQGKDNKCETRGARENKSSNETCYCDAGCRLIGDCCTDYKAYCKKTDCVVAKQWDEWGECDTRCGMGTKTRARRVLVPPKNGGEVCGPTIQKAVCEGTNCKFARAPGLAEEIRETGKILPLTMGEWRRSKLYDPFQDIRRNLFEKMFGYDHKSPKHNKPSYCARYELTDVRPACQLSQGGGDSWTRRLTKGGVICVECQSMAMREDLGGRCRGHGVYLKETRWAAVSTPGCHGAWVMTSQREDCECGGHDPSPSFILV